MPSGIGLRLLLQIHAFHLENFQGQYVLYPFKTDSARSARVLKSRANLNGSKCRAELQKV
jgi:hypothetical protein